VPVLLAHRQASFVTGPCTSTPLYVDSSAGFFRVQYSPEHFTKLARAFPELPTAERMALLTDTLALGQAEVLPLGDYFALVAQLRPSVDQATEVLFMQTINAFFNLDNALAGTQGQTELRRIARASLAPMLSKLGWSASKSETAVTLNLRKELIENLGRFADEPTLRKSAELFAEERNSGSSVEPSIRPAVMANVARRADTDVYTELVRRMMAAERVEDRELYASALGNVEDPELARRFLALSLEEKLPPDIASWLPGMLARLPAHGELAYTFTRDHFDALSRKQSEWGRAFLLPRAAATFNDAERAKTLLSDQQRLVGEAGDKPPRRWLGISNCAVESRVGTVRRLLWTHHSRRPKCGAAPVQEVVKMMSPGMAMAAGRKLSSASLRALLQ
jgi:aminopeptidase N